jgi:uroporphyrinogen-III synthase
MSGTLLITRPEALGVETAAAARKRGFAALLAPMLRIEPVAWDMPARRPDALLFTSAQAPAMAGEAAALKSVPAWAVGARTAAAAAAAGYAIAGTGEADGSAVVAAMARAGVRHALHLAGAEHAEMVAPAGLGLDRRIVYQALAATALPAEVLAALTSGGIDAALLYSARTAEVFARLFDDAGLQRGGLALVVISANTAAAAGTGWRQTEVACRPATDAMLDAASRLAFERAHG